MKTHWEIVGKRYEAAFKLVEILGDPNVAATGTEIERDRICLYPIAKFSHEPYKKIYRFGEDFADSLKEVDLNISIANIPYPSSTICIEFLHNVVYLSVIRSKKVLATLFDRRLKQDECTAGYLIWDIMHDGSLTIKELADRMGTEWVPDAHTKESGSKMFAWLFNALVYLQSGDPDLRELTPHVDDKTKGRRERDRARQLNENKATLPVILVGYDWKKPKRFLVDQTSVAGHFRWQPCGEKFSQVKLIWIDEHLRTYKEGRHETSVPKVGSSGTMFNCAYSP